MAFQGNLRDFSVSEVLQMLGTQRKTGCLMLEWNAARANLYVLDGRLVSTRDPGLSLDDPLLRFLIKAKRLSSEQHRGIMTIQRESNRDLEDLLVNGRYIEAEELAGWIERQILDDLMQVMSWQNGSYRFDPMARWPNPPLVRVSVEGALIEVARRVDEQRRFADLRKDPLRLLGVRDLPDADEQLSEEECDLFGIIDGRHTITEIVEAAPMSEYEAYEAVHRMLESNWIEVVGRREPADPVPAAATLDAESALEAARPPRLSPPIFGELGVAAAAALIALALAWSGQTLRTAIATPAGADVYRAASLRDVRFALELFRRERGRYPEHLEELVVDRWVTREQVRLAGPRLAYRTDAVRQTYTLDPVAR